MADTSDDAAELAAALNRGDLPRMRELVNARANVRYRRKGGYDAITDACYGHDVSNDSLLIETLRFLVESGAALDGESEYRESAVRQLSFLGRYDAVDYLLSAGADVEQLQWTPLMKAVALGMLSDVAAAIEASPDLEAVDWWSRTAWLLAVQVGDTAKAQLLVDSGASDKARGRCGCPALFYAIHGHHPDMVRWLLERGVDPNQTDDFGDSALIEAAQTDDLECVELLLHAGARVDYVHHYTALHHAQSRGVAMRLLDAGADPAELSSSVQRAIVGLSHEQDKSLLTATPEEFQRAYTRVFGRANPEPMNEPFWLAMIRSGVSAYTAGKMLHHATTPVGHPIWSADRFGQSLTLLPDGRAIRIGGEHEDFYDDDFCIYNDVFVHSPDGTIDIFGYPEDVFPPTDFHTATFVDGHIFLIGSLSYFGTRRHGKTPVYRLDVQSFRMERLETRGDAPGWIYKHRAKQVVAREIQVSGGDIATIADDHEDNQDNHETFVLDLDRLIWRRKGTTPSEQG